MQYCLYLRKSRTDTELEAHGEGETLARHEKALLALANSRSYSITQIYREIVSGETIAARPIMQQLLHDVGAGLWDGVLVMEVERLARGDTIDQGIVVQTFKYSDTKIITPSKTYNPNNEFDEEYFEFGLFMSRREYKTINRRLQRGRLASVREGKYVGNTPPYGYKRVKLEGQKGFTLKPIKNESEIVRMIFEWYTTGEVLADGSCQRLGVSLIVRRLNHMKIPSQKGNEWVTSSIRDILMNPVYAGKVRWNSRPQQKKIVDGTLKYQRKRGPIEECIVVDGLHKAIVTPELFHTAQTLMKKNPPRPIGEQYTVKNPLAGIIVCSMCGRHMTRRPYGPNKGPDSLICAPTSCKNVSTALHYVEERVLNGLRDWIEEYQLLWDKEKNIKKPPDIKSKALKICQSKLDTLTKQLHNTYTLLEQGIYTSEVFVERSHLLSQKIEETKTDISVLEKQIQAQAVYEENRRSIIPKVEQLLKVYDKLPSAKAKNDMLKEIVEKAVYTKTVNGRWHSKPDDFILELYPKLPKV